MQHFDGNSQHEREPLPKGCTNLDAFEYVKSKLAASYCQVCGKAGAVNRRQNTSYDDDKLNWATLCEGCQERNDEHWAGMWADYYSDRL